MRQIHLLGGPSGAGKTTWLLQTLVERFQLGLPVLGYPTHPVPWVYVASDRSLEGVHGRLTDIGINPKGVNIIPAWDKGLTFNQISAEIDASGAKLAVIESFGSFVETPGGPWQVKSFLQSTHRWIHPRDLTIIGVVESPKMKPHEKYEIARQRVSGVAAWGHFSETIFLLEFAEPKDATSDKRILTVCSHRGANVVAKGGFDRNTGRLVI